MSIVTEHVLVHWSRDAADLLPACGVWPGRDARGRWHSVRDRRTVLEALRLGVPACEACVRALCGDERVAAEVESPGWEDVLEEPDVDDPNVWMGTTRENPDEPPGERGQGRESADAFGSPNPMTR